jgi:hypothetical protein
MGRSHDSVGRGVVERTLEQYGVKGMRWGVTRSRAARRAAREALAKPKTVSEDAATKLRVEGVLAKEGLNAVSSKDLQAYVNRVNLEQSFASVIARKPPPTVRAKVQKFIADTVVDIAKVEATRVAKGQAALKVEEALRNQGKTDLAKRIQPKKK